MRFAARLLSLILCFELIMGGYGPSLLMSSNVWAEEKPCDPGTKRDEYLNRCLTTNQVASIKMATARCNSAGSKEQQQQCYKTNAENALQAEIGKNGVEENNKKAKLAGEKSPLLRVGSGAAIAVPLFLLTHQLFKKKAKKMSCKPASLMLMYAGAGVLLGGEVTTYIQHKNRLKKMKKNWEAIATPTSGSSIDSNKVQQTEAQSQAFEFLAQNEDSIAKTANTKFAFYASAAGLFAAGAVMAVVEKVKLVAANTAKLNATNPGQVYAAQKEIDRITCNVTKEEAKSREEKEKNCKASGGLMSTNGCGCDGADVKPGGEDGNCMPKTDEEKKEVADAKAKKEYDDLPDAKKEEIKKAKTAKVAEAETKLTETNKQHETASNNVRAAGDKYRGMIDENGNKKPSVTEDAYLTAKRNFVETTQAFNTSLTQVKSAQTNYDNVLKSTTGTPTVVPTTPKSPTTGATTSVGGNQNGTNNKKSIDLGAVAKTGLGLFGGKKPGENKGNQNPTPPSNEQLCGMIEGEWDGSNCSCSDGMKFDQLSNKCISNDGSIETFRNYKLKKTAEYNLQQSKNAYELLELTKELESIDIENYSRTTHYSDIDVSQFKKFSFGGLSLGIIDNLNPFHIANAQACSDDSECGDGMFCDPMATYGRECKPISSPKSSNPTEKKTSLLDGLKEIINAIFKNPFKKKGQEAGIVMKKMADKVDKAIARPMTRFAINGVFGTWIGIMSVDFKEQADISKKRAEVLRNMKDEFASNSGITNCTDAQRNSTAKPDCYCYTPAGQRNTSRTNSTICQKLWGTFSSKSGDYMADNSKVCLDLNSNPDLSCSCRTKIGPDGKNSCLKANAASFNISGLSTGSFKMLAAGTAPAADLVSGVSAPAQLNAGAAAANAMRIRKAADDMLKASDPKAALEVKKMSDQIAASSIAGTAGLSMGGGSGSSMSSMSPAEAVKALDEELKEGTTQDINTASSPESIGTGDGGTEKLEFGMTQEDLAIQEDQIAEVMNKDLDMDQADINKGSDTNLFDVLSNRYQRSGMRRLFDVNGKTEADKPAQSDINQ